MVKSSFSPYIESAGNVTNSSIKSASRNGRFVFSKKKGTVRWEARDSLVRECLNRILRVLRWFIHLFDYFDQSDEECLSECQRSPDRRCLDNRFITTSRWNIGPRAKLEALMGPLQWLIRGVERAWKINARKIVTKWLHYRTTKNQICCKRRR